MKLSEPKLSLRERNKIRLREELLDAVLDLFLDDDPNALNIEAVARGAGCSKATVYVYFPGGLNEMLCAIYLLISEEVYGDAMRRRANATSVHEQIMSLANALLEMASRPRRGKFYAQLNPALSPALQPVLGQASGRFGEIISGDLARDAAANTRPFAVLLVGALREASIAIARCPEERDALTAGFSALVKNLLAESSHEPNRKVTQ